MSPTGQRLPKGPPDYRQRLGCPTCREVNPWEENIVSLAGLESYEEENDRLGSILLGPQKPMIQMKIGAIPLTSWWTQVLNIQL
jgi:hypothetical protein